MINLEQTGIRLPDRFLHNRILVHNSVLDRYMFSSTHSTAEIDLALALNDPVVHLIPFNLFGQQRHYKLAEVSLRRVYRDIVLHK